MAALRTGYRVYLLRNSQNRRYVGVSSDVERRLAQHNAGVSRWTRGRGPWQLVWQSVPMSLGEARQLENRLKRQKGGNGLEYYLRHQSALRP